MAKPDPQKVALFLSYAIKKSLTGSYYVFKIKKTFGNKGIDLCKCDFRHLPAIEWIVDFLDSGATAYAPVIEDIKEGYRIDLDQVDSFKPGGETAGEDSEEEAPVATRKTKDGLVRVQFYLTQKNLDRIRTIAEAEGFEGRSVHSLWIKSLVNRALSAYTSKK